MRFTRLLTGEHHGYYVDFGKLHQLAHAYRQELRVRRELLGVQKTAGTATASAGLPLYRFVVNLQNHDQIGNRARGDQISALISFEEMKLAAGALLLSPFLPFIFMGQEYGEDRAVSVLRGFRRCFPRQSRTGRAEKRIQFVPLAGRSS